MAELLPEYWPLARGEDDPRKATVKRPKQVTDFHTWLQCFGTYCAILGRHFAAVVPELMSYLVTISRAHQDYAGLAWVRYDAAYRRNAAVLGNRRWSTINLSLHALCFAGRPTVSNRCELCMSTGHVTGSCPQQDEADPGLPSRIKAVESVVLSLTRGSSSAGPVRREVLRPTEGCRLFNRGACRFRQCKFRHVCSQCQGQHAAVHCPTAGGVSPQTTEVGTALVSRAARREGTRPY